MMRNVGDVILVGDILHANGWFLIKLYVFGDDGVGGGQKVVEGGVAVVLLFFLG